jgi:hypothetical protein
LAASRISSIPSRVKLIVVRVMGMAKSSRRSNQPASASADASNSASTNAIKAQSQGTPAPPRDPGSTRSRCTPKQESR